MLSRFFDRWTKSKALSMSELSVLRLFLPIGNAYAERLFSQATNAPFIERKLVGSSGYEAIIPYVLDDSMLIECDENQISPTISITTTTGATLNFTATILRGGFLRGLSGQALMGEPWQKEWTADLGNVQAPSGIREWIPQPMVEEKQVHILEQLIQWSVMEDKQTLNATDRELVRIAEPATEAQIRSCESRLRTRFGEQYHQLLTITNGFGIRRGRPYEFLGTTDIDFVESGREWLCLTPLYEEGCVAILCKDGIATNECFLLSIDGKSNHIGDIKQHVRESLTWEDAVM